MLPDRVSNPGPLTYESGALPIALRGPAFKVIIQGNSTTVHQNFLIGIMIKGQEKGKKIKLILSKMFKCSVTVPNG